MGKSPNKKSAAVGLKPFMSLLYSFPSAYSRETREKECICEGSEWRNFQSKWKENSDRKVSGSVIAYYRRNVLQNRKFSYII